MISYGAFSDSRMIFLSKFFNFHFLIFQILENENSVFGKMITTVIISCNWQILESEKWKLSYSGIWELKHSFSGKWEIVFFFSGIWEPNIFILENKLLASSVQCSDAFVPLVSLLVVVSISYHCTFTFSYSRIMFQN